MRRHITAAITALFVVVFGLAGAAKAQSQAEFKRELKAMQTLYKEPGLMEVSV